MLPHPYLTLSPSTLCLQSFPDQAWECSSGAKHEFGMHRGQLVQWFSSQHWGGGGEGRGWGLEWNQQKFFKVDFLQAEDTFASLGAVSRPGLHFLSDAARGWRSPQTWHHSGLPREEADPEPLRAFLDLLRKHGLEGFRRHWTQRGNLIILTSDSAPSEVFVPQIENRDYASPLNIWCQG